MTTVSINTFEDGIAKMPTVAQTKREWSQYDYGAFYGKKFKESLLNGTSPFLPRNGIVDIKGAYDMRTNKFHRGISQLVLKERQAALGAPSGAFVSYTYILKAQRSGFDCAVKRGERGIDIQTQAAGNELVAEKWFNISQIDNAENLIHYLARNMNKNEQDKQKWLDRNKPGCTVQNASEKNMEKENTKILQCTANTPAEYLGQVFAAMSSNAKLMVGDRISRAFVRDTVAILDAEFKPGKKDILSIFKLCAKANEKCKQIMAEMKRDRLYEIGR